MVIEKTINILPNQAPFYTNQIIKSLEIFGLSKDIMFGLKLSLGEALVNAAKHGNKSNKDKSIYLRLEKKKNKLEVWIKDQGKGFDYTKLEHPGDENIVKKSGRGIFLIKKYMDEIEFFEGGSKLKMIKYINQEER